MSHPALTTSDLLEAPLTCTSDHIAVAFPVDPSPGPCPSAGFDALENARRFALPNLALADATSLRGNAVSRIYIGIHFRRAVEEGVRHGREIAVYAVR